jgi:hypothetical protein
MGDIILTLFKVSFYLGMGGVFLITSFKVLDIALKVFAEIFGGILEFIHKIFGGI